jgi:hypothetical protein
LIQIFDTNFLVQMLTSCKFYVIEAAAWRILFPYPGAITRLHCAFNASIKRNGMRETSRSRRQTAKAAVGEM